jgi:hypothetical protein
MRVSKMKAPGVITESKEIDQSELTGECWQVQFWGLSECEECEYKDTDECGGKRIRKTGRNKKGHVVGQTGLE